MSNIYIQEPPTHGKILLHTTVGDIDIELWAKETPKACRNFVQLCLEGYYDGTIFHRLLKGFIVQGGDPTSTGEGGKSIYGKPFKDEFHSRLRFVRRGLVAMANSGKDDNASQFFFTLGASPELQNKHTIFGKVTGNTLYNMLKLEDALVDNNERPLYPHKIINSKVLMNPFTDIIPRIVKKEEKSEKEDKKSISKGTKNFKLLSFGEEAEEEEAEVDAVAKGFRGKSKSSHDLTNDPKLSSVPAVDLPEDEQGNLKRDAVSEQQQLETLERVRKKLRRDSPPPMQKKAKVFDTKDKDDIIISNDEEDETKSKKEQERDEIRKEIKKIQKELKGGHSSKDDSKDVNSDVPSKLAENSMLSEFYEQSEKYQEVKKKQLKKGSGREEQTLALLAKFQTKMQTIREKFETELSPKAKNVNDSSDGERSDNSEDDNDETWLAHTLKFEEQGPVVAKDANIKAVDRYEISDPRNPINERKRESSNHAMKGKKI